MIERAKELTADPRIVYKVCALEDFEGKRESFDVVISSLAFHYIADFGSIAQKVFGLLRVGGAFVFSVEHPIFTASGKQDWIYDTSGKRLSWPVDRYFEEGARKASFLGSVVTKYHRTLTTWIGSLLRYGFSITNLVEPVPSEEMIQENPDWKDELRRPMMLLVSAAK
jgi:SAM-dependent methyltransferase